LPNKKGAKKGSSAEEIQLKQIFKQQLMKWYYNAMYSGRVKSKNRDRQATDNSRRIKI